MRSTAQCIVFSTLMAALLVYGSGCASAAPSHTRASSRSSGSTDREVAAYVKLENAHRVSLGLRALRWDSRVAAVARAHSRDMFERHYFSHKSPDGDSPFDRLEDRDIEYTRAGENIAWGQPTGRAVLKSWLESRGHRENIERRGYTHHGVAKVGPYWTEVFITPEED